MEDSQGNVNYEGMERSIHIYAKQMVTDDIGTKYVIQYVEGSLVDRLQLFIKLGHFANNTCCELCNG